ncbi:MAG: ATP synthase F0 subunit B [Deltaproteobacteria bacterium]|nr:ATP synthase F0 subunit B [Deltaproteobacteria bacterium]
MSPKLALAVEEAVHHGNPGPGLDLVFREINFLILIAVLFFLLRKPVKEFFKHRSATLKGEVEEAKKLNSEARKQHEEISHRLKKVEQETQGLVDSFKKDGEMERGKLLEQARVYAEKIREDAKKIAENEVKKAREDLKEMTVELARNLAQKSIEREMTDADSDRLTKNYVERLRKLQ